MKGEKWVWNRELHGEAVDIETIEVSGVTHGMVGFTFTDGFAGIGGGRLGLEQANGVCTGGFEKCEHAREVYHDNWKREVVERGGEVKELLGAVGTFKWNELADSDVLLAGPPCGGWSVRGGRGKKARCGKKNSLMWKLLQLIKAKKYKAVVIEQVPGFARAENGKWVREMGKQLDALGYNSWYKELFCPDFGLCQSRKRGVILAGRKELVAKGGDMQYPAPTCEKYHPLSSVLEDTYSRREAVLSKREWEEWPDAKQRDSKSLKQVGMIKGVGPGRRVYSVSGLACTQKATGKGPGWCTGVYRIGGKLSRLTQKESGLLQGFRGEFVHDSNEVRARRQVGNAMPVPVIRAVGIEVGKWLAKCSQGVVERRKGIGNAQVDEESGSREWRKGGVEAAQAKHTAVMSAWQAYDEVSTSMREPLWWASSSKWGQTPPQQQQMAKKGVVTLEWYVWLRLERRKGLKSVEEEGKDWDETKRKKEIERVEMIMAGERRRRGDEEAPIHLMWWNWEPNLREGVREGIVIETRGEADGQSKDNYDTAEDPKAVSLCDEMIEKGYWEGPYDEESEDVEIIHPISAVDKKVLLGEGEAKKRVVIDMSVTGLNEAVIATRYMLPSVDHVARHMYRGCWFKKMDMKSGFYMSTIHPVSRRLLGIRHPITKRIWRWVRAPMGLASSPFSYSQRIMALVKELDQWPEFRGVRIVRTDEGRSASTASEGQGEFVKTGGTFVGNDSNCELPRVYKHGEGGFVGTGVTFFVDDGLIIARSKEACEAAYRRLVWLFESRMGVRMCMKKSEGPVQRI
jgi:DNA (cytosine-5)-methyltransferase 1